MDGTSPPIMLQCSAIAEEHDLKLIPPSRGKRGKNGTPGRNWEERRDPIYSGKKSKCGLLFGGREMRREMGESLKGGKLPVFTVFNHPAFTLLSLVGQNPVAEMTKKSQQGMDPAAAPMETVRNRKIKPGELTLFTRDMVRCDCMCTGQVVGDMKYSAELSNNRGEGEERQPERFRGTNMNLDPSVLLWESVCSVCHG